MANTDYSKLSIEEKLERARQRRGTRDAKPVEESAPDQVRLPVWPEAVRVVPNGFLRSALFGAIAKGRRRYITGEQIASIDGVEIHYKGESLDQADLDVWANILQLVRVQNTGNQCRTTSYALLKMLGKTDTGKNRVTLHTRIERLVANALTVKQGRYSYMGNLIAGAARDELTQEWVLELNPKLSPLFSSDQFTQLEWAIRHALDGMPLAQWLHGFYASHAQPFPMKIETLYKLCGSETARMDHFRTTLSKALDAVTEASMAHGQPFSYHFQTDLVHVEKTASGAQQRHLERKRTTRPRKVVA